MDDSVHEDHPCDLCDSAGRCTFACEGAESVLPPSAEKAAAARYGAMLVLAAMTLDDLSEPDPQLSNMHQIRAACARLRDEIRSMISEADHV